MEKFSGWRMSLLSPGDVAEWLDSSTEEEKSLLSFLGTVGLACSFNPLLSKLLTLENNTPNFINSPLND
jgi:hypothetical protein